MLDYNVPSLGGRRRRRVGSTLPMAKWFHCFIISLYYTQYAIVGVGGAGIRGPPRILTSELRSLQVVRVGQELKLTCPVEGEPSPLVDWYKDEEKITVAWFRYRLNGKNVRIRPVSTEDSGIIECKGVNGFGSQTARMRLVVVDDIVSPEFPENVPQRKRTDSAKSSNSALPAFNSETLEQEGHMHLSSGNTIRFRCEAKGIPMPKLTWLKDGKPVGEGENAWRFSSWILTLTKLTTEDSGNYTCKTDGKKSIEFTIQLHVTEIVEKKRPELASGFPNNTSVLAGNEAVLECVVRGGFTTMPPHIKWLKRVSESIHGNPKAGGHRHRLLPVENQHVLVIQESHEEGIRIKESQKNGTFVSKLIISRTGLVDHGVYICLATNNVGYSYQEARLTVVAAAAEIGIQTPISSIPFPLIVILLSISVAALVITAAYTLRKHQDHQSKQIKTVNPIKDTTRATPSLHSSSSYRHPKIRSGCEQQLLVSTNTTSTHSSSSSCDGHHHRPSAGMCHLICQNNKLVTEREPVVEIAMSRCSCYGDHFSESSQPTPPPPPRSSYIDHGFSNTFAGPTNHSLHFGHWT